MIHEFIMNATEKNIQGRNPFAIVWSLERVSAWLYFWFCCRLAPWSFQVHNLLFYSSTLFLGDQYRCKFLRWWATAIHCIYAERFNDKGIGLSSVKITERPTLFVSVWEKMKGRSFISLTTASVCHGYWTKFHHLRAVYRSTVSSQLKIFPISSIDWFSMVALLNWKADSMTNSEEFPREALNIEQKLRLSPQ